MFNRKNFLVNCDICDTRKMKEEDYSSYEKMMINADVVVVSGTSKSILNRLPVMMNQDCVVEVSDDADVQIKTVNGDYEITGTTMVQDRTLLLVNGSLVIYPDTGNALKKYEMIRVNGSIRCPKSLEGYLVKLSANGTVSTYPDDCVLLDETFILDKYFPLRAKEGKRYYAEKRIVIQDKTADLKKLAQKQVQFLTKQLIVPEEMIEECTELFDERTEFTVVPAGMTLCYGNTLLNNQFLEKLEKSGGKLFVYGNMEISEDCDLSVLEQTLDQLIVNGNVILKKNQAKAINKLNISYKELEFKWEGRLIENKAKVKIDKTLLENTPEKVKVRNTAIIKLDSEIEPTLILDRLVIENCAKVSCKEEQESAVAAVAKNVAKIGESGGDELGGLIDGMKDLLSTKMINAEHHVL